MFIKKLVSLLRKHKTQSRKLQEAPLLQGVVSIHAWDVNTGKTVASMKNHNLLTYNERDILIELLGNIQLGLTTYAQDNGGLSPDGNRRWLKWFAVGDGNTAAARTDLALDNELLKMEITSYGTATKVANALQIDISIPATDSGGDVDTLLNGNTLEEVGLFTIALDENAPGVPGPTGNEVMFSRQVHPGIPKTSSIQVDYTYSIFFT